MFISWNNLNKSHLIYFTLRQFLKYKVHIGMSSSFLDSTLNFYILIKKFNFLFFNLNYTILHFKLVLNIISDLLSKRMSIMICNNNSNLQSFLKSKYNNFYYVNFFFTKWISGFLTNFKRVYKSILKNFKGWGNNISINKKKIKFYLYLKFLGFYSVFNFKNPPFFLFVSNAISFYDALNESFKLKIPSSSFLDSNFNFVKSSFFIPGNSYSINTYYFYFYILFKIIYNSLNLEKLNFIFLIKHFYNSYIINFNYNSLYIFYSFSSILIYFYIYFIHMFSSFFKLKIPLINLKFLYLLNTLKYKLFYSFLKFSLILNLIVKNKSSTYLLKRNKYKLNYLFLIFKHFIFNYLNFNSFSLNNITIVYSFYYPKFNFFLRNR